MITLQQVSKQYDGSQVLTELSLSIEKGEFFVLVGPSGSGKTTLLKMLNRLVERSGGMIIYGDQPITDIPLMTLRRQIGYVFQNIALFPHMTVEENIGLIPELMNWPKEKRRQRARELLAKVGLPPEQYARRMPRELSGGEQQRVGIIRALAADQEIILMDEPFSALDPLSRRQLQELVLELHKEVRRTIVFVTHDMNEALKLGDRIAVMNKGRIVQCDTPEQICSHPANDFVRRFFTSSGRTLELDRALLPPDGEHNRLVLSAGTPIDDFIEALAKHPEGIAVSDADSGQVAGYITAQSLLQTWTTKEGEANE